MDWNNFWLVVNENLGSVLTTFFSLILSVLSFLISFFKTRAVSINAKINKQIVSKDLRLDLSKYYTIINGEEYCLNDLKYFKKGD